MLPWNEALIIIPTYNEAANVRPMISDILGLNPSLSLLIVDDHSPDGTAEVVEKIRKQQKNLHLIKRKGKRGLAEAYTRGLKWALAREYNYIFKMDCDFSHDPKQIKDLLTAAQTHHLVIGSRYKGGIRTCHWPFHRLLLSYLASWYIRLVLNMPIQDPTSGFKCFTRQALEKLDWNHIISRGYIFQSELNYKLFLLGCKIKEVPITFYQRRNGQSKMGGRIIIEALIIVFRLRLCAIMGKLPQRPSLSPE